MVFDVVVKTLNTQDFSLIQQFLLVSERNQKPFLPERILQYGSKKILEPKRRAI
jgi:hypothetical protein